MIHGPIYPSYFATNCYTCFPPKECPFPTPDTPRGRKCPFWNDNPFRTTSSGSGIEKAKEAWLADGYSKGYIAPRPENNDGGDEDEGNNDEL